MERRELDILTSKSTYLLGVLSFSITAFTLISSRKSKNFLSVPSSSAISCTFGKIRLDNHFLNIFLLEISSHKIAWRMKWNINYFRDIGCITISNVGACDITTSVGTLPWNSEWPKWLMALSNVNSSSSGERQLLEFFPFWVVLPFFWSSFLRGKSREPFENLKEQESSSGNKDSRGQQPFQKALLFNERRK